MNIDIWPPRIHGLACKNGNLTHGLHVTFAVPVKHFLVDITRLTTFFWSPWYLMEFFTSSVNLSYIEGILPKGPYPPYPRMADRALLAGYPRYSTNKTLVNGLSIYELKFIPIPIYICMISSSSIDIDKRWNYMIIFRSLVQLHSIAQCLYDRRYPNRPVNDFIYFAFIVGKMERFNDI